MISMTEYPFLINGHDFSRLVPKDGYVTRNTPETIEYTSLYGVDEVVAWRYRGGLTVPLNYMSETDATALFNEIASVKVSVTYKCLQTGETVTQTMKVENKDLSHVFRFAGQNYYKCDDLTFTEL